MLTRRLLPLALFIVPAFLSAQVVRIASYDVDGLGDHEKDYMALARVIANFDVVAAEDVLSAGGLEKVLGALADGVTPAKDDRAAWLERSKTHRSSAHPPW